MLNLTVANDNNYNSLYVIKQVHDLSYILEDIDESPYLYNNTEHIELSVEVRYSKMSIYTGRYKLDGTEELKYYLIRDLLQRINKSTVDLSTLDISDNKILYYLLYLLA